MTQVPARGRGADLTQGGEHMTVAQIPLDVLLGNPEKVLPKLSPDGKRMSYVAPVDGVLNVWVGDVGADNARPVTDDTDRGVTNYYWCHNNRHILYTQDKGGDENDRVYTIDLETGDVVDRTPFDDVQAQIITLRKNFPNDVVIGINKDNPQLHDLYRLNLTTGDLTKVAENPGFIAWDVDAEMRVRGAVAPQPDGGMTFLVRDTEDAEWRPYLTTTSLDSLSTESIDFTADGAGMYMTSSVDSNTARLVRVDLATGDVAEVFAEDPTYDVIGGILHPDTREPQLAIFLREKTDYVVLDRSLREDWDAVKRINPDGEPILTGRDHADRTWLIAFDSDAGPVKYYAFDRDTKNATFLFDHNAVLNDHTLAPMEPFSYKARDGLEVHGYITFPLDVERSNLPLVVNVHGGPWARDMWGFHPEAQFFANRGYLHIQPNFRGSTGYGKDFLNAGDREWGGKMQDDITDVVAWAIDEGFADPSRVCIYGGSYGGYAALAGATFTPDLYRCAIAMVGPSNLKTFIETIPPYWAPMLAMFKARVGDPDTEEEFLWSRSPLSKVDDIKVPMLIAHGANDPRVKLAETEQITQAMNEKGIDHELMVFEDEGHGFAKPENRLRFYAAVEEFLRKHL
jgi:dipeptidyl aminopeptidase/acylaminoacyl peptidase